MVQIAAGSAEIVLLPPSVFRLQPLSFLRWIYIQGLISGLTANGLTQGGAALIAPLTVAIPARKIPRTCVSRSRLLGGRVCGSRLLRGRCPVRGAPRRTMRARRLAIRSLQRLEFQIPIGSGRGLPDFDRPAKRRESQHVHRDGPRALLQIRKGVGALIVRGRDYLLVALHGGHSGAGNRQSARLHDAMIFGSHQSAGRNN